MRTIKHTKTGILAKFHGWGFSAYDGGSNNNVHWTVAIVELQNGIIELWLPESVQFMEVQDGTNERITE